MLQNKKQNTVELSENVRNIAVTKYFYNIVLYLNNVFNCKHYKIIMNATRYSWFNCKKLGSWGILIKLKVKKVLILMNF